LRNLRRLTPGIARRDESWLRPGSRWIRDAVGCIAVVRPRLWKGQPV